MKLANENKSTFNIVALVGQQKTSVFAEVFFVFKPVDSVLIAGHKLMG